jgi:hypothetical protein
MGGYDVYILKFDTDGNEIWCRQFGTTNTDYLEGGIDSDTSGVYFAGHTQGIFPGQLDRRYMDTFVGAFDHDGNELWIHQYGGNFKDYSSGIVLDPEGIYVSGYTTGILPGQPRNGIIDSFVLKYDYDGTRIWTQQFGGPGTTTSKRYLLGFVGGLCCWRN